MEILARKDKDERERKDKLASQMKYFHVAMKNSFSKFPHDPAELPAFFDHVENLFAMYEVPYSLRGPLLKAQLSDKAKAFIVRLSREQLDDYEQLKAFILNEFRSTPLQLRERFYTLRKVPDESYSTLQSKLANALTFYLRSRKIDGSFEGLFDLICSDRLKKLIPKSCLDFVLMQEKDEWLRPAQLSAVIDTYLASHFSDGRPKGPVTPVVYKDENSSRKPLSSSTTTTAVKAESKNDHVSVDKSSDDSGARRCFVCGGPHFKRDGPTRKEGNSNNSGDSGNSGSGRKFNSAAKANACAAGQQAADVENIQCASPAVQEGSDAQTRRCEFMSEVMTPPPLMTRPDYGTPSSVEGVDSFNVTAADHCASEHDECSKSECSEPCVDATDTEFYQCQYAMVEIKNLSKHRALIDSGSNVCCVNAELVKEKSLPVGKRIYLSGLCGQPTLVDIVRLHLKPVMDEPGCVNVAPAIHACFTVVPGLNEDVIITPSVNELLQDVAKYNVLAPSADSAADVVNAVLPAVGDDNDSRTVTCDDDVNIVNNEVDICVADAVANSSNFMCAAQHVDHVSDVSNNDVKSVSLHNVAQSKTQDGAEAVKNRDFFDPEIPDKSKPKKATADELCNEQRACPTLHECWDLAKKNKGGFFIENDLLYHRDRVSGAASDPTCFACGKTRYCSFHGSRCQFRWAFSY
jgi:hypothetical protein